MNIPQAPVVRVSIVGMRWVLVIASVLVFITGIQLFLLSEQTDRYFAWTIKPPLTAAFLGAAYWASCAMEFFAARRRSWAQARIAVPAVLLFTVLTLVVSLVHLDRFHFAATDPIARMAAWVWLVVYALVPLLMGGLLVAQLRAPGGDPPRGAPLSGWVRLMLSIHAVLLIGIGAVLLLAPQMSVLFWPWSLTPLTARAIGAWALALGVAAGHAVWENDWARVQVATMSYMVFALFELIALVRYAEAVAWDGFSTWGYVVFLISVLVVGVYGWRRAANEP